MELVFSSHFVYVFSRKMFLMLCSINCVIFIAWFLLLLEIIGNMCIPIVCFPGWDVINFEINLIFLIKPFFYKTKKSRQKKLNILRTKRGEIKSIFNHFLEDFQLSKIVSDLRVRFEIVFKQHMSTGCPQWSIFSLEIGYSWCAARFSSRPIIFSHLH